ncbi:MAG TPA: SGNH/GDSL hydrolase family protein [Longimicrobium sp.]|nr:SGNH/GDSL hydrolase family protein [Longimicrobium sp.]
MADSVAPSPSAASRTPPSRPAAKPPRGGRWTGALLALGSLAVSLVVAEIALRILRPLPDPYAVYKQMPEVSWPGSAYVPSAYPPYFAGTRRAEPGLPGMDTVPRRFSHNSLGYRGDSLAIPKPPGEVRVFMVGGSTTECVFLDDREAVTARLQAYLRQALPGVDVRVYGAGKSGDRSWDHVAMVGHRIAHLQPDAIVVFAGINDVMAGVAGRDYLMGAGGPRRPMPREMMLKLALSELHLGRLVHAALARHAPQRMTATSGYREAARHAATLPPRPLPRRPDPTPYAENLASLAGIARAQGARMVLMTQATTWNTDDARLRGWHWMVGIEARYPEPDLDAVMNRYNRAMLGVGAAQRVPVFDLAAALPKSADFFYDDVHFNIRGADTAARLLARFMVEEGVVSRPAAPTPPLPR